MLCVNGSALSWCSSITLNLDSAIRFHLNSYVVCLHGNRFCLISWFNLPDLLQMLHCLREKFIIRACGVVGSCLYCSFLHMLCPFSVLWLLLIWVKMFVYTPSSTHDCKFTSRISVTFLKLRYFFPTINEKWIFFIQRFCYLWKSKILPLFPPTILPMLFLSSVDRPPCKNGFAFRSLFSVIILTSSLATAASFCSVSGITVCKFWLRLTLKYRRICWAIVSLLFVTLSCWWCFILITNNMFKCKHWNGARCCFKIALMLENRN